MNKSTVIGIVVLLLVVAGGVGYKLYTDMASGSPGSGGPAPEAAQAKPLQIAPAAGYVLDQTELDGKSVPVLRIPLDTWGGYAALFAANKGSKPSADSLFYKLAGFGVELVKVEGAQAQLDGFASGRYHILWSGMDSLPVLYHTLKSDRRVVPQVIGLFDWSTGGDGIVVRQDIKTPKDLRGKTILTSGNTPQNFFLLWLLAQSGIAPSEVKMVYLGDGEAARDAFLKDSSIAAWVTWEPFVSSLTDPASSSYRKDLRTLITSRDANQLIADIYLARLDLVKEKPELVQGFVKVMLEGEKLLEQDPEPAYAAMSAFFGLSGSNEARSMVKDVHIPNLTESRMFFNLDNPINAWKIFYMAQEYQKSTGALPADASWEAESVVNTRFLDALADDPSFAGQPNRVANSFNKQASFDITDLENQRVVLTEDLDISFDAQKLDFDPASTRQDIVTNMKHLATVAQQMEILGTTVVKLAGHLDTTKVEEFRAMGQQSFIEASSQAKLISKRRAEFIKKLLVEHFGADPERIYTEGKGWEQPVDEADPARNRRVEVRFLAFE